MAGPPSPGLSQTISAERTQSVTAAAAVVRADVIQARRENPSASSTPATMATTPDVEVQPKPMRTPKPTSAKQSALRRGRPTVADTRRVPMRTPKPSSSEGAQKMDRVNAITIAR